MALDKNKIEQAIRLFLEGIGEDPNREGLRDTPKRVAKMWDEFESYREMNMTIFEEVGNYDEMVVVRDIQFYSLCEHHLLPFFGKAHVAYIPDKKVCGLSKIVRVVNKFSYRPQVQERLTAEIAEYLEKELQPKGVAVIMEAVHLCMAMRGVRNPESITLTSKLTGRFLECQKTREEFLNLINSHKKI